VRTAACLNGPLVVPSDAPNRRRLGRWRPDPALLRDNDSLAKRHSSPPTPGPGWRCRVPRHRYEAPQSALIQQRFEEADRSPVPAPSARRPSLRSSRGYVYVSEVPAIQCGRSVSPSNWLWSVFLAGTLRFSCRHACCAASAGAGPRSAEAGLGKPAAPGRRYPPGSPGRLQAPKAHAAIKPAGAGCA